MVYIIVNYFTIDSYGLIPNHLMHKRWTASNHGSVSGFSYKYVFKTLLFFLKIKNFELKYLVSKRQQK